MFFNKHQYNFLAALVCDAPNEVHSNVTPMCPRTCNKLPTCLGLINEESCQCALGYVRLSTTNNTCVKDKDCPAVKSKLTRGVQGGGD